MDKPVICVLVLLFLINFITGLFYLNEGLFHFDSIWLAQAVENTCHFKTLQPQVRGRYGSVLLGLIVYLPFSLLGQNADLAIRITGILFHSLSIVIFFLFVRELFASSTQAFFASLLLSFTPLYFQPNTYGKEHGASLFFILLAFYLLNRGLRNNSLITMNLASAALIFSVSIRESAIILIPLFFLLYFKPEISTHPFRVSLRQDSYKLKSLILFFGSFFSIFSAIFFPYLRNEIIVNMSNHSLGSSHFTGFFSQVFAYALADLFKGLPFEVFLLALIGLLFIAKEKKYFNLFFLLFWLGIIFYIANVSTYVPRYLDTAMVPIYCFASYALLYLYEKRKIVAYSLTMYIVLSMFLFMLPMLELRHHYNGAKRTALSMSKDTSKDSLIIAHDFWAFLDYYGRRKTLKFPGPSKEEAGQFVNEVKRLLNNKVPVYVVTGALNNNYFLILRKALLANFDFTLAGQYLNEDYHSPELQSNLFKQKLFRLRLKEKGMPQSSLN